ncbi:MAG TPA: TspO/MBR family protein [Methylophilaceae bacterium]|jgi:tryptophan-rich sensory protein
MHKRSYWTLLLFILIVAGVAASGVHFQPGAWYEQLAKPFWTPPNWLFPPVWSILYVMIAVAGWLIFSTTNQKLKALWVAQLALNGLWSWLFFGLHNTRLGLIDITLLLICIAMLLVLSRKTLTAVTWLMSPYLIWVAYAFSLNAAILVLNPA